MGATGTHRDKGMTDREFFEREFPTALRERGEIVVCSSKPSSGEWNRVFYAAVRNSSAAPYKPGETWALVVLMHTSRTHGEHFNFTYKEMSEDVGPGEVTCPPSVLDALSPTDDEHALAWRAACREHAAKREAARLADGDVVRFTAPLSFGNGESASVFRFRKQGRRSSFTALTDDGALPRFACSLGSSWYERPHTVARAS